MKNLLLYFLLLCITVSCGNSSDGPIESDVVRNPATLRKDADEVKKPVIEFKETEYHTGKIAQGEVVQYSYEFTNTGEAPLIISDVQGSCGCTVMKSYPKGKIAPGEGGTIDVEFNSEDKWGEQTVTISVTTNAIPSLTQLLIKTNIIVPDNMKTKNNQ